MQRLNPAGPLKSTPTTLPLARRALRPSCPKHSVFAVALALLGTACIGGNTRGKALYPTTDGVTPAETEVARLTGEIGGVDGRDVSGQGQSFELLPGCHVVTTRTSWGKFEYGEGLYGNLQQQTFVIHMQPNRSYDFEYELMNRTGSGGTLALHVRERDANARVTAELLPATSQAELANCHAPGSKPKPPDQR
jgi:hypothetical protein